MVLKETKTFALLLVAFTITVFMSGYLISQGGYPAITLFSSLLSLLFVTLLVRRFIKEKHRLQPVLRALANNDDTMGLSHNQPLIDEFKQVREQIHLSRNELELQHQFLRSMLIHLDVGIAVINAENKISQINPALKKLLGHLPNDISHNHWGVLGKLILNTTQNSERTLNWQQGELIDTLSIRISLVDLQGKPVKILSAQSIYYALQAQEQQAYKRLTKVLTHEIANSIMPMVSLADTCKALISSSIEINDADDKADIEQALTAISRRAQHLDKFVSSFAEVTRLPEPNLERTEINALISQVTALYSTNSKVEIIRANADKEYWAFADIAQIEQVLVNLIKNSLEVMDKSGSAKISISVDYNELSQLFIDIEDSGPDILPHVLEQIFVPFFTTKQKGSGIGLSLSKQIMINHGGDLTYVEHAENKKLEGAHFRLTYA